MLSKLQKRQVHTRRGDPASVKDLMSVSVEKASTVIIMQPDGHGKEASVIAPVLAQAQVASAAMAVMSLTESGGSAPMQNIVMQKPSSGHEVSRG